MEPQPLVDFISLGFMVGKLRWPVDYKTKDMITQVKALIYLLERVGFEKEKEELQMLMASLSIGLVKNTDYNWQVEPLSTGEYFDDFQKTLQRIYDRSMTELGSQRVLLIDQGAVTTRLRELQTTITGEEKQIIFADTLRCLETGAYRAAIVMGWNLAYEHLRRWIFKSKRKRLKDFNAELTSRRRSAADYYDPVKEFEDFYDLKESMVLDVGHKAKLLPKQKFQVLGAALNDRNHFAHPSSRRATAATATGFIENLVVNILDDPMFAYD